MTWPMWTTAVATRQPSFAVDRSHSGQRNDFSVRCLRAEANYAVEEIEYDPPYPFDTGVAAISTGDDTYAGNIPIGFTFSF